MAEYDIQGPTRVCTATGRQLKPGDRFYGLLIEECGKLVRKDFAAEAWPGPPEGHLAYWVGKVPVDDKPRKPVVNDELLLDCFDRLKESTRSAQRFLPAVRRENSGSRRRTNHHGQTPSQTCCADYWIGELGAR